MAFSGEITLISAGTISNDPDPPIINEDHPMVEISPNPPPLLAGGQPVTRVEERKPNTLSTAADAQMLDSSANAIEDSSPTHPIAKGDQRIRAQETEIQQKSFKQVLLDPKFNEKFFDSDADDLSTDDELMSDGEMEDLPETDANLSSSIPRVLLPQSLLKKIRRPWKDCLIVKLMGMSIGYKALLNRVKRLWEIQGDFEAVDLGLGFFLFKFEVKSDFTKVFTGGPWVILDHYLTVRKWKADFKPSVAEDISTAVWVRFPQLPIEYYNEKVLFHIAKLIGKPIKVDLNTATTTRGRYARVCVEINLGNSLTSQFAIVVNSELEDRRRRRKASYQQPFQSKVGVSMEVGRKMSNLLGEERNGSYSLNLKETELCLGLPGGGGGGGGGETVKITGKRGFSETVDLKLNLQPNESAVDLKEKMNTPSNEKKDPAKPPAKAQVVGWPPVRSYRKNIMTQKTNTEEAEKASSSSSGVAFVKVCMDGAPYLRKVDLKMYKSYQQLSDALAKMFSSFTMGNYGTQGMIDFMNESKLMDLLNSSEYVPTYEDKDGDWMLVGDVPWEMFVDSCKRLRIMKGSEAIGLAPRAMEKCKSRI